MLAFVNTEALTVQENYTEMTTGKKKTHKYS